MSPIAALSRPEDRIAAVIQAALVIPVEEAREVAARARRVRDFTPLFDPSRYIAQEKPISAALAAPEAFLAFRLELERVSARAQREE